MIMDLSSDDLLAAFFWLQHYCVFDFQTVLCRSDCYR